MATPRSIGLQENELSASENHRFEAVGDYDFDWLGVLYWDGLGFIVRNEFVLFEVQKSLLETFGRNFLDLILNQLSVIKLNDSG